MRKRRKTAWILQPPVLLVDGYNVAHEAARSPGLSRARRARIDPALAPLDAARASLLLDLAEYSAVAGVRVVVAFDAMGNAEAPALQRDTVAGVDVVFTAATDADAFLIAEARRLAASGCPRVVVATADRELAVCLDWEKTGWVPSAVLLREMARSLKAADAAYEIQAAADRAAAGGLSASLKGAQAAGLAALKERLLRERRGER